jgi:heme exporter protein A
MHIEARGLCVERAGRVIFADLSFSLAEGRALTVTGPNGAGKSTLLRVLAGLLPLAAGMIEVTPQHDGERALLCHYVGHADALKGGLTVAENLTFWSAMLSVEALATKTAPMRLEEALDCLGLGHVADIPAAYLSAGQKRRAALARLLVAPRPVWLLDEPLTSLDRSAQASLTKLMETHLALGGLLIAATHAPLGIEAQQVELGLRP